MIITPTIHIGREIEARINQLHITATEFARRINTSKQNVNRILKKESIDTATLQRYCEVLDYNFFSLYYPASSGKIQHVGEGAQLNEAGASGNINAPGLASLSSSLSSSGDVARLEMELKQAEARIAEKDARIADLKEMISQLLNRG